MRDERTIKMLTASMKKVLWSNWFKIPVYYFVKLKQEVEVRVLTVPPIKGIKWKVKV